MAMAVFLVLLVSAFIQGALPAIGLLGMAKPPILLSAVIYYALSRSRFAMLLAAFVGGVIHDSLGFTPLGCSAFCFCLTGLLVQSVRELLFKDSLLTVVSLTALTAALMTVGTWLFLVFGEFGQVPDVGGPGWLIPVKAVGAALLALLAAPPVFGLARGLDVWLGQTDTSPT